MDLRLRLILCLVLRSHFLNSCLFPIPYIIYFYLLLYFYVIVLISLVGERYVGLLFGEQAEE